MLPDTLREDKGRRVMKTQTEDSADAELPTTPCSVVWSKGHAYVLEGNHWRGVDDRGRPQSLTAADLERRGWSRTRRAG